MKKIICSFIVLSFLSISLSSYAANKSFARRMRTRVSNLWGKARGPLKTTAIIVPLVATGAVGIELLTTGTPEMNNLCFYTPSQRDLLLENMKNFTPIQAMGTGIITGSSAGFSHGFFGLSKLFYHCLDENNAYMFSALTLPVAYLLGLVGASTGTLLGVIAIPTATVGVQALDLVRAL